jgi:two-component system, OmpR family, sensor kinase
LDTVLGDEKSYAFLKFFGLYFLSVSSVIAVSGYLFYVNGLYSIEIITFVVLSLLVLFGLFSYFLAKNAIKPFEDAMEKLDIFSKDFIHDLNTPITSMKLNVKLIQKDTSIKSYKAVERLNKSLLEISELHQNLNLLLEEKTFMLEWLEVPYLVYNVVQTQEQLYPNIRWYFECQNIQVYSNAKALRQILNNLLSNACKYNSTQASVTIKCYDNILIVEDSGIGIKDTELIFKREYKETEEGFGIGLDIVKRLCDALNISVYAESIQNGSRFTLKFENSC